MIATLSWAMASLVLSIILRNRRHIMIFVAFSFMILVPYLANGRFVVGLTLGGFLAVAHLAVQALHDPNGLQAVTARNQFFTASLFAISVLVVVANSIANGRVIESVGMVLTTLVTPYVLFIAASHAIHREPLAFRRIVGGIVFLAVVESVLGWAQYLNRTAYVWGDLFATQWWWSPRTAFEQPVGTFGHWIAYSVFLASSLSFVLILRHTFLRLTLAGFIFATILLTAARTGLIMVLIVVGVFVITSMRRIGQLFQFIVAITALGALSAWAVSAGLADVLLQKLDDDSGSADLRVEAITWVGENWNQFVWAGSETGSNVLSTGLLSTSLENAFFFFAADFGAVGAIILFLTLVMVPFRILIQRGTHYRPALAATAAIIFSFFTYGSFGYEDTSSLSFFWLAAALGLAVGNPRSPEAHPEESVSLPSPATTRVPRTA